VEDSPRKLTAVAINLCLLLPVVVVFATAIAAPIASAEATCDVPAGNPPEIAHYFEEYSVEDSGWGIFDDWDDQSALKSLDRDFSTDMTVYNDSANAIKMELVPGYQYTFCLYLSSDSQSVPTMGAIGDVYLMNEANWRVPLLPTLGQRLFWWSLRTVHVRADFRRLLWDERVTLKHLCGFGHITAGSEVSPWILSIRPIANVF